MGLGLWRRTHWLLWSELGVPSPRGPAEGALRNRRARATPLEKLMALCWEGPEHLCFLRLPGDLPGSQGGAALGHLHGYPPSPTRGAWSPRRAINQTRRREGWSEPAASEHSRRPGALQSGHWSALGSLTPSPRPCEEGSERSALDGGRSEVPG